MNSNINKIIFLIVFLLSFNIFLLSTCSAQDDGFVERNQGTQHIELNNPLGKDASTDPNVLIGKIINGVLGVVGSLALVMFIYGGFVWMTARGNQEAIRKGKDILTWAIIGMVVIFTSYAAVSFVLNNVVQSEATQDNSGTAGGGGG